MHPLYHKIFPQVAKICYLPSLEVKEFQATELLGVDTNIVYRGLYRGNLAVAKFMTQRYPHVQDMLEAEYHILLSLKGSPLLPKPYTFFSQIPASNITGFYNLLEQGRFQTAELTVLVREHIFGRQLNSEESVSASDFDQLKLLIQRVHQLGYSGIGLANRKNFIVDQDDVLHFIDLGAEAAKNGFCSSEFDRFVLRDLQELETLR